MVGSLDLLGRLEQDLLRSRPCLGGGAPWEQTRSWRRSTLGAPYPGLRPFLADESRFFYGRNAQVQEIGRRLTAQRCVAVLGGSGSGKSSIVRAGVIPALRRKLIPDRGDLWRAAVFTPGRAPIDNLIEGLARTLYVPALLAGDSLDAFRRERRSEIRELIYREGRLEAFMSMYRRELGIDSGISETARAEANLLVVIDQFEELFREENHGKVQVSSLVNLLVDFWCDKDAGPGLYLALTMRTDDLHRCAEFIDLPDLINATSFLTRRLREDELREVIVQPVRGPLFRSGLLEGAVPAGELDLRPFAVEVVAELLDAVAEISHDPDHLPLLQHLLAVLWRHTLDRWRAQAQRDASLLTPEITREDLAAALGFGTWQALSTAREHARGDRAAGWLLRQCLNRVADGLIDGGPYGAPLSEPQREIARVAFCLMGEVDDRGNCKRRWTTRAEIARVAGVADGCVDIEAVVTRCSRDHRLLWAPNRGELDISHEALMRNWERLGNWLRGERNAAQGYKQLAVRYEAWQQRTRGWPQWTLPWAFWLRRRGGLLRGDQLDRLEGELTRKQGHFRHWAQRYNSEWSSRYLKQSEPMGNGTAAALAAEADSLRYRFLRWSIFRDRVQRVLPVTFLGLFALIAFQQALIQEQKARSEMGRAETANNEADRLRKALASVEASKLWVQFPEWVAGPDDNYVKTLWDLRKATPETRAAFVAQLPDGRNFSAMGNQPQIVRAVGLTWPEDERHKFSELVKEQLSDPATVSWRSAALVCASAVLMENDRLDEDTKAIAVERAKTNLRAAGWSGTGAWIKGRTLTCMGPHLDEETWRDHVSRLFEEAMKDVAASPENLSGIASGATSTAWFLKSTRTDKRLKEKEIELLSALARAVVRSLPGLTAPEYDWKLRNMARPLVSLVALLPLDQQRSVLEQLLEVAQRLPSGSKTNWELLLIIAQAFEVVAEQHREGDGQDLAYLIPKVWPTGSDTQASFNRVAVARLILPLVEVAGADEDLRSQLDRLVEPGVEWDGRNIGLWGRHLALLPHESLSTAALAQRVSEATEGLRRTTKDRGPRGHFDGEGVARGIAALTEGASGLDRKAADGALATAKEALALTGSAEEAAALARAIVNLVGASGANQATKVDLLLDVLKYPNAGVTAREPLAKEPKNATDILLRALLDTLDPQRGPFELGPAYYAKELHRLEERGLLTREQLERAPVDPRPKPKDLQPQSGSPNRADGSDSDSG